MPDTIAQRLTTFPKLSKAALCELWKELFNAPPPQQLRRHLMIPILAYRLQEQTFGSLTTANRGRLRQLARVFEANSKGVIPSIPGLVNVEANGYEYQGARYQSLSEIARLITGTRWSGPLFFGIRSEQANTKSKETQ
jgi:hypothetical protein